MLPQRADAADLVMPSKLTGMLASGEPCGVVVVPEQPRAFADALLQLALDAPARARMGEAGRRYAEAYLHIDGVLGRFVARLKAELQPKQAEGVPRDVR